jgi:hypothetical protein
MPAEADVLEALVSRVEFRGDVDSARRRGDRIRRTRRLIVSGIGAVALLAIGGGALALTVTSDDSSQVEIVDVPSTTTSTPGSTTTTTIAPVGTPDTGWAQIAGNPLSARSHLAVAWSGTELIVWGGLGDLRDGAAYTPATASWRRIADPPGEFAGPNDAMPTTVFTDREMLVVRGELHMDGSTRAAAYDPSTDAWRMVATPPFEIREGMHTAWTGREAIFYGGVAGDTLPDQTGYLYDPAADEWRDLPQSPLGYRAGAGVTWTGTELVVLGGSAMKSSAEPYNPQRDGAAYDPRTDEWRTLPPSPYGNPRAAYATPVGVIVFDDRCDDDCTATSLLDPSTGVWRDISGVPFLDHRYIGVVGDEVVGWSANDGAAISATTASWRPMSPLPGALKANTAYSTVAVGEGVAVVGPPGVWLFVDRTNEPAATTQAAQRAQAAAEAAARAAATERAEGQGAAPAVSMAYRLHAFALEPSDGTFADLPLADEVTFAFGTDVVGSRSAAELRQPASWRFDFPPSAFAGPFSALDALAATADISVTPGVHDHCTAGPVPPPPGAEGLEQVSMVSTGDDSCLQWFAVDLFLRDGEIAFVRYDLYEP